MTRSETEIIRDRLDMLNIDECTPQKNMYKRIENYFDRPEFIHYSFSVSGTNWIMKWKIEMYNEWRKICDENSTIPS